MANIGGFLSALGGMYGGLARDRQDAMQRSVQQSQLDERQQTRQKAQEIQNTFRTHYKAAMAGDLDAQSKIVSVLPDAANIFPKAAKPEQQYDPARGAVVTFGAGQQPTSARVPGLPERPATATAPHYDADRGGFVAPGQPFQPVQGLPPKAQSPVQQDVAEQRKFQRTQALGQDYKNNPNVKGAYDMASVVTGLKAALSGEAPVDDLSIIYQTVKMFDPNSAVREGEISLFKSANSLPAQLQLVIKRWNSGRTLTPQMRQQIGGLLDRKVAESQGSVAPVQREFGQMARRYGVEADSAFIAPDPYRGLMSGKQFSPDNPFARKP